VNEPLLFLLLMGYAVMLAYTAVRVRRWLRRALDCRRQAQDAARAAEASRIAAADSARDAGRVLAKAVLLDAMRAHAGGRSWETLPAPGPALDAAPSDVNTGHIPGPPAGFPRLHRPEGE
jgi:hypothetical protein